MVTSINSYTVGFCLFNNNVAEISVIRNESRKGGYTRNTFFVNVCTEVGNSEKMFALLKEKCKEFNTDKFEFSVSCSGISSCQKLSEQDTPQKAFEKFMGDFRESYPRKKIKFVSYSR